MRWSFLFALVSIVVDALHPAGTTSRDQLATNLLVANPDSGNPAYRAMFAATHLGLVRWPGGGDADLYQWSSNTFSRCSKRHMAAPSAAVAFDRWMRAMILPSHLDVAITVNYGSNASCTGGGDPNEAAAWVRDAREHRYPVTYWTVGNEPYFTSETDRHPRAHDAATYAQIEAAQFYPRMKAADPHALVGIPIALGSGTGSESSDRWDETVLAQARYDFVEIHFYPSYGNTSDDRTLLADDIDWLARIFAQARDLLARSGHASTPIVLGEFDRDSGSIPSDVPGHETLSIVDALFTGEVIGEAANANVRVAASWLGIDGLHPDPHPSPRAYGLQRYGSWGLSQSGSPSTLFPKAQAYRVAAPLIGNGARVLPVHSSDASIRAYATREGNQYTVMLINTDPAREAHARITFAGIASRAWRGVLYRYGKTQYESSRVGRWSGPSVAQLPASLIVDLPPWSLVTLEAACGASCR